jgi:hypothetical protein
MDCPERPACILSVSNSLENWRRLGAMVRMEITK